MATVTLALALLFGASQTSLDQREREAIGRARSTIVRSVESTLPNQTLEAWLRDVFGAAAKTAWEVNDCGEQTGDPQRDRGRDVPMCVDVAVTLDSRRVLHLLLGVGTFKTGVRREPPTFSYGVVLEGGAPTRWLKSLSEATTVGKSSRSPFR